MSVVVLDTDVASALFRRRLPEPLGRQLAGSLDGVPQLPGVTVDEARLAEVCARDGIARLLVFGSVACGTATPDSDVDVRYELEPGRRLGSEIKQLADELAALFDRPRTWSPRGAPPADSRTRCWPRHGRCSGLNSSCLRR